MWVRIENMKKTALFFLIIVTFSLLNGTLLFADNPAAELIFGDGYGFTLQRDGKETVYDLYYDDVTGLPLMSGDFISTDKETFLEIRLSSSRNVLKIAENSSVQIMEVTESGGGRFALTYGRIRARVAKLGGGDHFVIAGRSAAAGVRGTDFGYDILAERVTEAGEAQTIARVYCFDGEVELVPFDRVNGNEPPAGSDFVLVRRNEMAVFSVETIPVIEDMSIVEIEESVRTFWDEYDFEAKATESVSPASIPEQSGPVMHDEGSVDESETETSAAVAKNDGDGEAETVSEQQSMEEKLNLELPKPEISAGKKAFFITGTALIGAATAAEITGLVLYAGADSLVPENADQTRNIGKAFIFSGVGALGGGLISYLLMGLFD